MPVAIGYIYFRLPASSDSDSYLDQNQGRAQGRAEMECPTHTK